MSVKFSLSSGPHRISDAEIYFSFVHQNHGILLNVDYRPCVLHKRIRCFHWSSRKFNTLTPSLPNIESGSDVTRSFSAPASQPDILDFNRDLFSFLFYAHWCDRELCSPKSSRRPRWNWYFKCVLCWVNRRLIFLLSVVSLVVFVFYYCRGSSTSLFRQFGQL